MHEVNGNDKTGKMHISWRHSRSKKKSNSNVMKCMNFIAGISQFSVKFNCQMR